MKRLCQHIIFCFAFFFLAECADAQNPIIAPLTDLSFGMVLAGTNTNTIASTDAGAGSFETQVTNTSARRRMTVQLTFTLPRNLTNGADNLAISFSRTSASYNTTNDPTSATTFNPANGYTWRVPGNSTDSRYFWIGGTVSPTAGQAAGTYTGTITATVTSQTYSATLSIVVTATVISGLSLTAAGSVNFGEILAGTTPASLNAQSNINAPIISAAGARNNGITVTYSSTSTLNDGSGNTLTFTPSVYGSTSSTDQAGSTPVSSGSRVTLTGLRRGTGYYYFWLGGDLGTIPLNQPAGNYNGTFTLSVSY
jgi:hypothetical protein